MKNVVKLIVLVFLTASGIFHSCKKEEIPALSTSTITNITSTSASGGGIISSDGGAEVTARGVCWGANINPTTSDTKTNDGVGEGQFVSTLDGLTAGSTYHVRAYATNSVGTAYGADLSFATSGSEPECITQPATNISVISATLNGTVNANYLSTTVTFEFGMTTTYGSTVTSAQSPVTGNNITNVSADISGLTPGTTYHYRIKAINSIGTTNGNDLTFTSGSIIPTITTTLVSNVSTNSATTGGNITSDGGATVTARGVCWAITPNPNLTDSKTYCGTGTGTFISTITGLSPGTLYHVRAYATNSSGTAFGDDLTFTTLPGIPTVTTTAITNITHAIATSGGNISSDGGYSVTARGVCWGTTSNPIFTGSHTSDGTGTGIFISNIAELAPGTLYHVRAYATNSSGTAYGDDLTFNTLAVVPIITTMAVTDITRTSATSGGNISSDGGSSVTARGVCWGTTSNPIITGSHTSDGTGSGVYISNLNGLDLNTVYYVRAYAINRVGIAYGVVVSFTTIPILVATLTTDEVISITETSAVSGGNITDDGGAFITERGICWSTEGNPTVSNDKTIDGSGTGSFTSNLTGLPCGRTYYVRAYAVNSAGIAYGSQRSFTTKMFPTVFNPNLTYGSVSDIDENLYKTIQIGNQIWMAENLRTNKYSDGTIIPNVTNDMEWRNLITGAYCWFNHDETTYKATYGALYNWFAVNTGKLCPTGWHVPSDGDWATLSTYLGGDLIAGGKMKEKDTTHWVSPNISADNSSGFTALPGGNRENYGAFLAGVGLVGYWWRSSERVGTDYAWIVSISNIYSFLTRGNSYKKTQGFSVRCIKD